MYHTECKVNRIKPDSNRQLVTAVQSIVYNKEVARVCLLSQCYTHIETSKLISTADQLTGFYISVTMA